VVVFRANTGSLPELRVVVVPKHSGPVLIAPPASTLAMVPLARLKVSRAGSVAVLLTRHKMPPVSLNCHDQPMTWVLKPDIDGSVPEKPE
jgi:hypothetical protein